MEQNEDYDANKLFKYELVNLNPTSRELIESYFKYFRCIHNLCLLNYFHRDLFTKTEAIPREVIDSDPLYYYAYEEYLDRVSGFPKRYNKNLEYMSAKINYFRVDNVEVINNFCIRIPNVGYVLCKIDDILIGKIIDSYIYKKHDKYYVAFITDKYPELSQEEILFNTRKTF